MGHKVYDAIMKRGIDIYSIDDYGKTIGAEINGSFSDVSGVHPIEESIKPTEKEIGLKYDGGKLRWDLLPYDVLEEVVQVYTEGAKKYSPNNWKKVDDAKERYFSALMRHLVAWRKGEIINTKDFGLSHMAHVIWNAMALSWLDMNKENK